MSTKLDKEWAERIREGVRATASNVDALIMEVERLERVVSDLEAKQDAVGDVLLKAQAVSAAWKSGTLVQGPSIQELCTAVEFCEALK